MIEQFYAEHFGTSPGVTTLALVVLGVVAVLSIVFVSLADWLRRQEPEQSEPTEHVDRYRWLRLR